MPEHAGHEDVIDELQRDPEAVAERFIKLLCDYWTHAFAYEWPAVEAKLALARVEETARGTVQTLAPTRKAAPDPEARQQLVTKWGEDILRDIDAIRLRSELNFAALDDPALADTMRR